MITLLRTLTTFYYCLNMWLACAIVGKRTMIHIALSSAATNLLHEYVVYIGLGYIAFCLSSSVDCVRVNLNLYSKV